jgi:hypothetical protein
MKIGRTKWWRAGFVAGALTMGAVPAVADEGGVSFWIAGQYGSLAAAPLQPGWSFGATFYHASDAASGEVAAARQATIGRFPVNVKIDLNANLSARPDLLVIASTYVFSTPVLGGQLAVGLASGFGHAKASIDGTLTALVGGIPVTRQGSNNDERSGIADLYPQVSLRWNHGVHNYMVYAMGDIPTGTYDPTRLVNFGIGHGAADVGFGYTYLNPQTGWEFSAVTGFTYNFKNVNTDYQNGIDWHLDWGASKFVSKQTHIGLVGYFYQQLTDDRGAPDILDGFRSRVIGIGPQIGHIVPLGDLQGYLNLKGYYEFEAKNRPDGWNVWLTFAISPAARTAEVKPPSRPVVWK